MKQTKASQKSQVEITTDFVQTWDVYRSIQFSYLYHNKIKLNAGRMTRRKW